MSRARGIAVTVGAWLLVGAAINLALAWGIALYEASGSGTVARRVDDGTGTFSSGPWPGPKPWAWPDDPNPPIYSAKTSWITCRMWVTLYPAPDGSGRPLSVPSRVQRWDVGLPLKSMAWEAWTREQWDGTYVVVPTSRWREGIALGTRTHFGAALPRVPLMVDWWAFAANAAAWGGLVWVMSGGVWRLRRAMRAGRNRCVKCGYDRAGLPEGAACPECGRRVARDRIVSESRD